MIGTTIKTGEASCFPVTDVNYKNHLGIVMPKRRKRKLKDRNRQRENRKEKLIEKYRENRIKDLTPYNAVRLLLGGKSIAYK